MENREEDMGVAIVSAMPKTWILDLDGTVVKHNGYLLDGFDSWLPGAKEFLLGIPDTDMLVFITSRKEEYREVTEQFLREHGIRYTSLLFEAPYGERILINDRKRSGLRTALAVNTERDKFCTCHFQVNEEL